MHPTSSTQPGPTGPLSPGTRPALPSRAEAHAGARAVPGAALASLPALALASFLALALAACGDRTPASGAAPTAGAAPPGAALDPAATEAARGRLERMVALFQPVDPSATTDRLDQSLVEQRAFRTETEVRRDAALGRLALERFRREVEDPQALRVELLRAAAWGLPRDEAAKLLEEIVLTYDAATGYGVRGQAVGLWADVAPESLVEVLRPILSERRHRKTLPPDEELLRSWVRSARAVGRPPAEIEDVLAEVTTNIYQDEATRHLAIGELAKAAGDLGPNARRALEEVLVESSRNGYLRRKAAQAIAQALPAEDACRILSRVADRESDQSFLVFLADLIDGLCP